MIEQLELKGTPSDQSGNRPVVLTFENSVIEITYHSGFVMITRSTSDKTLETFEVASGMLNLSTRPFRVNPKCYSAYIYLREYHLGGNSADIFQLLKLNAGVFNLTPVDSNSEFLQVNSTKLKSLVRTEKAWMKLDNTGHDMMDIIKTSRKIKEFLPHQTGILCCRKKSTIQQATQGIHKSLIATSVDVRDLDQEMIDRLCIFDLSGLRTRIRISKVIDGDTIIAVFYNPLQFLAVNEKGKPNLVLSPQTSGMFIKQVIRITGIDAAEKNTLQGIVAREILRRRIKEYPFLIAEFQGFEKYGRLLAKVMTPDGREILHDLIDQRINPEIISNLGITYQGREIKDLGFSNIIIQEYSGGTKSEYMNALPVIRGKEIVIRN